jgi:hypothetical protein
MTTPVRKPLTEDSLANLDAGVDDLMVPVDADVADEEVNVGVRGQLGGVAVGLCAGGEPCKNSPEFLEYAVYSI